MDEEFVSYEQAVALKELGFTEDVFQSFVLTDMDDFCKHPLKQQVFRWFREKYDAHIHPEKLMPGVYIIHYGTWTSVTYNTYEESESACIDKLIELAKQ